MLLHDVLTMQKPWPGDHGLFLLFTDFYWVYIHVLYPLSYKAYNHPTLRNLLLLHLMHHLVTLCRMTVMVKNWTSIQNNLWYPQTVILIGLGTDDAVGKVDQKRYVSPVCGVVGLVTSLRRPTDTGLKMGNACCPRKRKCYFVCFCSPVHFPLSHVSHHFHLHSYLFSPFL